MSYIIYPQAPKLDFNIDKMRQMFSYGKWITLDYVSRSLRGTLNSIIKVKAIDKAGNERLVEYIPPIEFQKPETVAIEKYIYFGFGAGAIIIVLIIFIIWLVKKIRHKTYEEEQL